MLKKLEWKPRGPIVLIIMDGVGIAPPGPGNAVTLAKRPNLESFEEECKARGLYCQLKAHGSAVGLPDSDMGNSEVGHNALGSGQIIDQGTKLVTRAIETGDIFRTDTWKTIVKRSSTGGVLHFIGLLSDGNVHSHIDHLFGLLDGAVASGIRKARIHILLDGRDVPPTSSLKYIDALEEKLARINDGKYDYKIASGGGRMYVTMDRYESDWNIVKRGWNAHVRGVVEKEDQHPNYSGYFRSAREAVLAGRKFNPELQDQYAPPFVIVDESGQPVGRMRDGDSVVLFNFRGDRALEISRAFDEDDFNCFDRVERPDVFFCGLMEYDAELKKPKHYLVEPPVIPNVSTKYLCEEGVRQFAVAETHKFGHVTYFWNGNTYEYFNRDLETYQEVESLPNEMTQSHPAMKAREVADVLIETVLSGKYDFLRCNFANGDMLGHTGDIQAATQGMEVVDREIGRVVEAVDKMNGITIIVADHGNCEEMLIDGKVITKHSLNPVPFMIIDKNWDGQYKINTENIKEPGLSNVAATFMNLLGFEAPEIYRRSLITFLGSSE